MTLVMALGNREQVIQVSDRAISAGISIVSNSYNKATVIKGTNGRFAMGFTGIAVAGLHDTQSLLIELAEKSMVEAAGNMRSVPEILAKRLSEHFGKSRILRFLPKTQLRLTVMLSGYLYDVSPPMAADVMISNYQDFANNVDHPEALPNFTRYYENEKMSARLENPTLIQRIGNYPKMRPVDEQALRKTLEKRLPASTIVETAVGILRRISDETRGTVGKDISSIVVPSDPAKEVVVSTSYLNLPAKYHYPDSVEYIGPNGCFVVRQLELKSVDTKVESKPKRTKVGRNERCTCGSGLKYKRCCGQ